MEPKKDYKITHRYYKLGFPFCAIGLAVTARPGKGRKGQVQEENDSDKWFGKLPLFLMGSGTPKYP